MKIEKLEVSQHLDTRKLYEEVFSKDEKSFVDYYYQEKTKDNIIYVVREDDDIQAMLHLNPYTLMVNGTDIKKFHFCLIIALPNCFGNFTYFKPGTVLLLPSCGLLP